MRHVTFSIVLALFVSSATAQANKLLEDTTAMTEALIGEWHFIQVLGPDGKPTDHIDRGLGPNGQTIRVKANGPDMTIRTDRSYEKRFTPDNKDAGYWSIGPSAAITYTMVIPMDSKQGEMLRFSAQMFNKTLPTDGRGNFLDSSTDTIARLTPGEMWVIEEGYTFVYRKQ